MTDLWQPGKLYAPGDIVQPRITDAVAQSALDNPTFESGDTGWDSGGGWSILQENPYAGTWSTKFSAGSMMIAICAGGANSVARSTDGGVSWSLGRIAGHTLSGNALITAAPELGKWFIWSDTGGNKVFESTDSGANWSEVTLSGPSLSFVHSFSWVAGLSQFVAGGDNEIWMSPNGAAWTQVATIVGSPFSVAYDPIGNILLLGAPARAYVHYSDDGGVTWSTKAVAGSGNPTGLIWSAAAGLFMACESAGTDVYTSPDGAVWTVYADVSSMPGGSQDLAYSPTLDRWVKVGNSSSGDDIEYSDDDGATWTGAGTHVNENYRNVVWDAVNSLFTAFEGLASPHRAYTSPDGDIWTVHEITGLAAFTRYVDVANVPISGIESMGNDARLAVTPGQQITAQVFARIGGEFSAYVGIGWYDSGAALLSVSWTSAPITLTDAYRRVSVRDVAPDNAATCSVLLRVTGYGDEVYFDNATIVHTNPVTISALLFKATQAAAGFSDSFEPTWPTVVGNTVVDNEVTWEGIPANRVLWQAFPILVSGSSEPTFPAAVGAEVADNTISWVADTRRVTDPNCPNTKTVAITASKIFAGDADIIPFSATINPLDWTTPNDAGYIPFGLNTYGSQDVSALGLYRSNLVAFNSKGFQMWQVDEDPANFAILDAVPVGCPYYRSLQPVMNDLVFETEVGVRSMGIAGASSNLAAGQFGKNIDPLVKTKIKAGEEPI